MMNRIKRMVAICAAVAMLSATAITAMAVDNTTIPTGGVCCTQNHEHTQDCILPGNCGVCCTLDHEHTQDCILPGSHGARCTLDHNHTQDCIVAGSGVVCCTLDHEHTESCILPGSGAGCGTGRGVAVRDGRGTGHHGGGRGRHCA